MRKSTGDIGSHDQKLHVSNRDCQGLRRIGKYCLPDPQGVHGENGPVRQGLQDFRTGSGGSNGFREDEQK